MDDHAIVVVDVEGTIHLWSNGAERFFGYSAGEAVGRTVDFIIPEALRERHWTGFHLARGEGRSTRDEATTRLPVIRKDGSTLGVPARFVFLRDPANRAFGAVGIFAAGA
jgi:PAS domain S-box-containing protein